MLRTVSTSICLLLMISFSGAAKAVPVEVLLYDVDFEDPLHVVGQAASVGMGPAPRVTPSSMWFGDVMIADGFTALPGQVLLFDQPQLRNAVFGVGSGDDGFFVQFPIYRFEADILIGHLEPNSSFKVFTDLPIADSVSFESDGWTVQAIVLGEGGSTTVIGTFTEGTSLSLRIEIDRSVGQWTIWLDGNLAHQAAISTGRMRMFRLSAKGLSWPLSWVAADNVSIYGVHFEGDCNDNGQLDETELVNGGRDCNGNGVLDECDFGSDDADIDGVPTECDNCPGVANRSQMDRDGDGVGDRCDPCPLDPAYSDSDSDGDGISDCDDQCPGVDDAVFAPDCVGAIPTVSTWGIVVLTLLLLTGGKLFASRLRQTRPPLSR